MPGLCAAHTITAGVRYCVGTD